MSQEENSKQNAPDAQAALTPAAPSLSIIIPALNEHHFIGKCLDSLLQQDYPVDQVEILVIDGRSQDDTRQIVEDYSRRYPQVRLLDNPRKITPAALNVGVRNSRAPIIVRIDAHCEYARDHVSRCVKLLKESGADNAGGALDTVAGADTTIAKAIAYCQGSSFGFGGAKYRQEGGKPGPSDTAAFGTYHRELFDKIGLFDEDLLRNQDFEFNCRIISNGGMVYCDPSIKVTYFSRPTLSTFLKMLGKNSLYHWMMLRKLPKAFRLRHTIPAVFVMMLAVLAIGGIFCRFSLMALGGLLVVYAAAAAVGAWKVAAKYGAKYFFVMPMIFFLSHLWYGVYTWAGFIKFFLLRHHGAAGQGEQTGRW